MSREREEEAMKRRIRQGATAARGRIEDVLLTLRELPAGVDRSPLSRLLERAVASASTLSDLDVEHDVFFPTIDELSRSVREAGARFAPLGGSTPVRLSQDRLAAVDRSLRLLREVSIDALVAMQDRRLRSPRVAAAPALDPFRASVGVPGFQAVLRAPPRAILDLGASASPGDLGEADEAIADLDPEDEVAPAPLSADDALLVGHARALARDCLGDLASLSGLRAPLPEAPWTHAEPFERRLLANLDALLALAFAPHGLPEAFNVFEEVQRYAREAAVVDPGRELARALTFACTRGEHALRAVVLTLKQAHPDTLGAYRDALCLARHPATAPIMRELLLADPDPRCVALAVEVLRFLREARVADLVPLSAHPDPRVRVAALRAFSVVPDRAAAVEVLVDALADEEDPRVGLEIAGSLVRLSRGEGLAWVRARADVEPPSDRDLRLGHLRILAIAGGAGDVDRFLRFSSGLTPHDAALAGLFGHPGVVPHLLDSLAAANSVRRATGRLRVHPVEVAAALALDRITGAHLCEERDETGETHHDAGRWAAFWDQHRGDFEEGRKLRWGKPYSPLFTAQELLSPGPAEIRGDLALELSIVAGDVGFEPSDWVARQRGVLAEAEGKIGKVERPAGTFLEAWLTRI